MATLSQFLAFDQSRANQVSFELGDTRDNAQEYRFEGKLSEELSESMSLTTPVMFSLASRAGQVTVTFIYQGDTVLSFTVEPGIPLVFEVQEVDGNYPDSWTIAPVSGEATIELLTFLESPEEPERFIWLRSGHGLETALNAGEIRVVSWTDTRETALAKAPWLPSGFPRTAAVGADPEFNNQPSLSFTGDGAETLIYSGEDLDALPVSDFTVMFIASTSDDGETKIAWATENMTGGVSGFGVGIEGGYRTLITVREDGNTGLADQISPELYEIGEKPTVWIVEYMASTSSCFVYRQGVASPELIPLTADGGGLKSFRIGGARFGLSYFAAWIGKIVDIRVHNRLLTNAEKSEYLAYASTTYGIVDTEVPVFPWTTGATVHFRANRGITVLSGLYPTAVGTWRDTRYEAPSGSTFVSTESPSLAPTFADSEYFNDQPAISFSGTSSSAGASRMALSGLSPLYDFLAGDADFTYAIVFRNTIANPGGISGPDVTGYTLFSAKIGDTAGGLWLGWGVGSYQSNEMQTRIRKTSGGWGDYWLAAMDTTPEVATSALIVFDSGTSGDLVSPSATDTSSVSGTPDGSASTPFLGGDTSTEATEERNKFVGEVVELFWMGSQASDEEITSWREYLEYKYGITG